MLHCATICHQGVQSLATKKLHWLSHYWPPPGLDLLGSEEDTVVLVLEHGARILAVGGRHILFLIVNTESHVFHHRPHCAVGRLDAVLASLV